MFKQFQALIKVSLMSLVVISFSSSTVFSAEEQEATAQPETTTQVQAPTTSTTENTAENTSENTTEKSADTAAETKADTRNISAPTALKELHKSDINHYINADEVSLLLAGPDDFITLIQENKTANSKGVAILLADWQQTATAPKAINFLRNEMPNHGWTTLSIQPPTKPNNYPSQALALADQQTENTEALNAYQNKLSQIIAAVMEKANDYPGIFIVIAEGNNGAILTELYQQGKNPQPNGLILLSSYMFDHQTDKQFALSLAQTDFPVLDLYLMRDNPLAITSAKQRLSATKKEMKAAYRQRQITNSASSYYPDKELMSAIKSWMSSVGW